MGSSREPDIEPPGALGGHHDSARKPRTAGTTYDWLVRGTTHKLQTHCLMHYTGEIKGVEFSRPYDA